MMHSLFEVAFSPAFTQGKGFIDARWHCKLAKSPSELLLEYQFLTISKDLQNMQLSRHHYFWLWSIT
jgi:hypothetical protein